jgi:hypothetical protein
MLAGWHNRLLRITNVYDGGSVIYDLAGNQVGGCNPAWGQSDPACEDLSIAK